MRLANSRPSESVREVLSPLESKQAAATTARSARGAKRRNRLLRWTGARLAAIGSRLAPIRFRVCGVVVGEDLGASENPGDKGLEGSDPAQDAADGESRGCRGEAGGSDSYVRARERGVEVDRRD